MSEVMISGENRETTLRNHVRKLTSSDLLQVCEDIVELNREEEKVSIDKSTITSKYNAQLKRIRSDMRRLMNMLDTKEEKVEVECYYDYNYKEKLVSYYSCESGELVNERSMTNEELQLKLFDNNDLNESYAPSDSVPRCHMTPMKKDGDVWRCQSCKSTKPVEQVD